jgi:hypothetical protein
VSMHFAAWIRKVKYVSYQLCLFKSIRIIKHCMGMWTFYLKYYMWMILCARASSREFITGIGIFSKCKAGSEGHSWTWKQAVCQTSVASSDAY